MHLIGLVDSPDHVCCRYRLRAFRDEFVAASHQLEILPFPNRWWRRIGTLPALGRADAVIIQRRLLPPWQSALLRRCTGRLIFDFDDAVFMRDSYAAKGPVSHRRQRRFAALVRAADAVVAGNDWLAARARAAGATGPVAVIPSCVDPALYPRADHAAEDGVVRLVWVGSSSTLHGLERSQELLDAIAARVPGIHLRLISDRFPNLGRMTIEQRRWAERTETAEIATGDIGISIVPDDEWSRGKCGLKVLQYMAAGLPVIANPVGVHAHLIRHGQTGFLANSPVEWVYAVRALAGDADLRKRMGALGRRRVENEFSVSAGGRLWRDLLGHSSIGRRAAG